MRSDPNAYKHRMIVHICTIPVNLAKLAARPNENFLARSVPT